MRLYHNQRCSKSRSALLLLKEAGVSFEEVRYLETGLTEAEIRALAEAVGVPISGLMRQKEALYRELALQPDDEAGHLQALLEHPGLLERPLLVDGKRAVIARPPERVYELLPPSLRPPNGGDDE